MSFGFVALILRMREYNSSNLQLKREANARVFPPAENEFDYGLQTSSN